MELKKIQNKDLVQVSKLHAYCTSQQWSDRNPSNDDLTFYTPSEILGLFEDGKLVSMIRNYTFKQSVRGEIKKMGGISHVATFPEYRLKGCINDLIKGSFLDMKTKNQCVSTLHPFKESFYSTFGYVGTNDNLLVKIPLEGFKHYLKYMPKPKGRWKEERVRAIDVQEEFENFKFKLNLEKYHGLVFLNELTNEYWVHDHYGVIVVFIKKDGKTVAAAKYIKTGLGASGNIFVPEMYWMDSESRIMLFKYFAKHKDQFLNIELRVPYGENFFNWFYGSIHPIEVATNGNPWMVRIIDAEKALKNINVKLNSEVILELYDEHCEWNNGFYKIEVINSKLKMSRCANTKTDVKMDIKGLTALLYGVYSLEELELKKWIEILNIKVESVLNEWFPNTFFHNAYYY